MSEQNILLHYHLAFILFSLKENDFYHDLFCRITQLFFLLFVCFPGSSSGLGIFYPVVFLSELLHAY